MRDVIFKRANKKADTFHYHVLFWTLFIAYEIILAAAIREKFNHFADYLLHYLLNILLFYTHCYFVLRNPQSKYPKVLAYVLLEMVLYYFCSVWISYYLITIGVPVNVPESSTKLFQLSMLYRFIYIAGMSTAFRIALNLIDNKERLHKLLTQNLMAEKEKEALRAELASAKLSFLRSQINPHFLFNSLNSIYNRIRQNDKSVAESVMALAELMQYALQPDVGTTEVPLDSEVQHISNYLKIQVMRYSCEVNYRVFNDDPDLKIIPLLLVNAVENIFQHGDLRRKDAIILVEITASKGKLEVLTSNPIRPDQKPGSGMGLANTRKILELFYKERYSLKYGPDQGIFNLKLVIKPI